ncbi:Amidophosphoribosyltransferase [subsurface metagenome]
MKGVLADREVVIVDDSIVRGTTMRNLVRLLRQADVAKVHVRVSSPPIRHHCQFGLDFPTEEELIANRRTKEQIEAYLGVDSLIYLSLEGMLASMDLPPDHFCTACFSGEYPITLLEGSRKDVFEHTGQKSNSS